MTVREGEVKDTRFLKETSSSVSAILLRPVLVNMDRINHTFLYSNRRIPDHANFVAMTQSLKGCLARDFFKLWTILQYIVVKLALQ